MKKQLFLPLSLAALAGAALAADTVFQQANNLRDELNKKNTHFGTMIDELEKFRAEEICATNPAARAHVDKMMLGFCQRPGWTSFRRWNYNLLDRIPSIATRDIDDPQIGVNDKLAIGSQLAVYYAGEKMFKEAEEIYARIEAAAKTSSDERMRDSVLAGVKFGRSDLFRYQDRFGDAWRLVEEAAPADYARALKMATVLANADGNKARAEAILMRIPAETRNRYYGSLGWRTDAMKDEVFKRIMEKKAPEQERLNLILGWYAGSDNKSRQALATTKGMALTNLTADVNFIHQPCYAGNWPLLVERFELLGTTKTFSEPVNRRMYLRALGVLGRLDDAAKFADEFAAAPGLGALDKAKYAAIAALARNADAEKAIMAGGLERKDVTEAIKTAVSFALVWCKNDAAESLAKKYGTYFLDYPQRTMKVPFIKEGVATIPAWRKVVDRLDRQLCDRKFGANLDAFATDVATGKKGVEATEFDSQNAMMEISAACDVKGVHVFLYVRDPAARSVENGFAGGIGNEMYFAPGKYEPYVCFSSNPRTGPEFAFQTCYDSKANAQIDLKHEKNNLNCRWESEFTDTDYVQHLFFSWDTFYQKMPVNGSKWRFECIAFCPSGSFSLGGSKSVHNSSKFCDLEFQFKPEELTAIRRAMLYRAVKGWRQLGRLDRFDKWADQEIGDPEFYNEVLKPIEKELQDYAKMVKPEMTDDDVNRVFEKALPRWLGISHEIDQLRRTWLQSQFCR